MGSILALNWDRVVSHDPPCLAADEGEEVGRIINIASAHALVASPYKSAYVAAKHGSPA
jgi:3-hydroxybutyrate dehydrogenase